MNGKLCFFPEILGAKRVADKAQMLGIYSCLWFMEYCTSTSIENAIYGKIVLD
jgi:hypothetical protein